MSHQKYRRPAWLQCGFGDIELQMLVSLMLTIFVAAVVEA